MTSYNEKKNTYVRKQMLNTLLEMLKMQKIDEIIISDFIEKAGIARVSFYRNYSSNFPQSTTEAACGKDRN